MNTPPPRPSAPPTGTSPTWPYLPSSSPQTVVHHHYAAPTAIPTLPSDHHDTVDWARIRRAAKVLRAPAVLSGLAASPFYTGAVLPLAQKHGVPVVGGAALLTLLLTAVGAARGLPRSLCLFVLVATAAGTLELLPATLAVTILEPLR